jgi:hypothetical protein
MPPLRRVAPVVPLPSWFKHYCDYAWAVAWCQLLFEAPKLGHMLYDDVYHVFPPLPGQAASGSHPSWLVFHLLTAMKLTFLLHQLLRQAAKDVRPTTTSRLHRPFWWLFNMVAISIALNSAHLGDAGWLAGVIIRCGLVVVMYGLACLGDLNNRAVLAALHAILTLPTLLTVFKYLIHGYFRLHILWSIFAAIWCGVGMHGFVELDVSDSALDD